MKPTEVRNSQSMLVQMLCAVRANKSQEDTANA